MDIGTAMGVVCALFELQPQTKQAFPGEAFHQRR
jgi:hypothetical protein